MRIQPPPVETKWIGQDDKGKWWCGRLETADDKKFIVAKVDGKRHEVGRETLKTL